MKNFLKGKRVLFMGDSITALYMGERGWPKYFCDILEPAHHASTAVSGATWRDKKNTIYDGNPMFMPKDPVVSENNVMGNQVEKLKKMKAENNPDYLDFDVIIMAAGTNDISLEDQATTDAQFFKDGEYVPLENVDRHTWGGAIRYVSESLYELYPNAYQFICTPIQAEDNIRPFRSILAKGQLIKDIAARLSIRYIDTLHCGIYGRYEHVEQKGRDLHDGIHPAIDGAKKMGFFNAMAVKSYLG